MQLGTTVNEENRGKDRPQKLTTLVFTFRYTARIGTVFGLGMIIGPAIGGTLSSVYGYTFPSLAAAAIAYFKLLESLVEKQTNPKNESFFSISDPWQTSVI